MFEEQGLILRDRNGYPNRQQVGEWVRKASTPASQPGLASR